MLIINDALDIASRIKEIDDTYIIRYDKTKQKFKVLRRVYEKEYFQCYLPFNRLDARAVQHLYLTRRENLTKLIQEIDSNNLKIEAQEKYKAKQKIEESLENSFSKFYKRE